ncbi:hypothetical protein IFM89_036670 [Coptis chinensis]|uniref:Uncharacterized protein n=1 Tax=Coptis chinensis TaxID=261450 RepID=A0A835M0J0_9MAGN|nr:hypothetical protein IFM89_036670 [Coptis chinensis]
MAGQQPISLMISMSTALEIVAGLLTAYALKALYFGRPSTDLEITLMSLMACTYHTCWLRTSLCRLTYMHSLRSRRDLFASDGIRDVVRVGDGGRDSALVGAWGCEDGRGGATLGGRHGGQVDVVG